MIQVDLTKTIPTVDLLNAISPERIFQLADTCEDRLHSNRNGSREGDRAIIANTIRAALMEAVANIIQK